MTSLPCSRLTRQRCPPPYLGLPTALESPCLAPCCPLPATCCLLPRRHPGSALVALPPAFVFQLPTLRGNPLLVLSPFLFALSLWILPFKMSLLLSFVEFRREQKSIFV